MRRAYHYNILMRAFWPLAALLTILTAGLGGCAHDTSWLFNASYPIIAVDQVAGTFTIADDYRANFVKPPVAGSTEEEEEPGELFYQIDVDNSTLNDGIYSVTAVEVTDGNTVITVEETILDATANGYLMLVAPEGMAIEPSTVQLYFRTLDTLDSDIWYYMVFNFSKAPEFSNQVVPDDGKPFNELSNVDRGRNWELYVVLHPLSEGNNELYALQRPRLPTLIETGRGPMDVATGYFTEGEIPAPDTTVSADDKVDIAVACKQDGKVQLILGLLPKLDDPVYFAPPLDIAAGAGPGPMRLHAAEFTGDANLDLLVLYEGDGTAGSLRVLAGDGAAGFTRSGVDVVLTGRPVDWQVVDVNADGRLDVAVLTQNAGAGQVQTYLWEAVEEPAEGELAYTFAPGPVLAVGGDPVAIASGEFTAGTVDLVVADGSELWVFTGAGDGTFAAAFADPLEIDSQINGVAAGTMIGARDDIVVTYLAMVAVEGLGEVQRGFVQLLRNTQEEELAFETSPQGTVYFDGEPGYLLVHNTGREAGDLEDVVVVDGRMLESPSPTPNQTLYILRGDRDSGQFAWDTEIINYLTAGAEPTRIHLADFDGDGFANDFVIPNSVDDETGNSVNVFIGLGQHNYTSTDRYWTDDPPQQLNLQEWHLSHTVGPNYFELFIDPEYFYDLTRFPRKSFVVDFMTGTSAIEYDRNSDGEGRIEEHLTSPVVVPIVLDHFDDDQLSPKTEELVSDPSANIDWWKVEVL